MSEQCQHCGKPQIRARGLCVACYARRDVRARYPTRKRNRTWTAKELRHMAAWRREGLGYGEIARRLGRTHRSVESAMEHYGLQRRRCRLADHEERLRQLHAQGLSDPQVARQLGVSVGAVWRWRSQLGLAPNGPSPETRRRKYQHTIQSNGVQCLGELRWLKHRLSQLPARREQTAIPDGADCVPRSVREPKVYREATA